METRVWLELLKKGAFVLAFLSLKVLGGDLVLQHKFAQKFQACKLKKSSYLLSKKQRASFTYDPGMSVKAYAGKCSGGAGKLFVISDRIRTHYQSLLIMTINSAVVDFEIVRFEEPLEYRPKESYLNKLKKGQAKKVDAISGATLTGQSLKKVFKIVYELLDYDKNR